MRAQPDFCCLTIAGSDSGGGAGLQADLRIFQTYGLHGCSVVTAVTAQNPSALTAVSLVPAACLAAQLDAVLGVFDIRAIKTGLLPGADGIELLADRLDAHPAVPLVVDPVMVSTSGTRVMADDARAAMIRRLLPRATLVTPNLPEAAVLCGASGEATGDDLARAREYARAIHGLYGCAVLVKGGHARAPRARDVLFDGRTLRVFSAPWVERPVSTHGTGCSLSAAVAAELAYGATLADAVAGAKKTVRASLVRAHAVGPSCGAMGLAPRVRRVIPSANS